jgi:hypothetical protein
MTDNPIDLDNWEGGTADQQLDEHPENCDCIVCAMQDAPPATAIPPAREATWRVEFLDFRDYHDWIGPSRPKRGGVLKFNRRKLPQKEHRDFFSRAAAHEFAELLRADYGGEIACVIVDLKKPPPSPMPVDELLPGHWPLQSPPGAET